MQPCDKGLSITMAIIQCSECGANISSMTTSCPHCGFIGEPGSANYERHQLQQFRALEDARQGRAVGAAMTAAEMAKLQRFGFPAFLSFFVPGLGQLVKGDILRGIGFFIIAIFGAVLAFAIPGFGLLVAAAFWVWNIWDAYTPG